MELLREADDLEALAVTEEEAQGHIVDFLREHPEHMCREWDMLNHICSLGSWRQNRVYRKYYLAQLGELARAGKVVRYRKGFMRGKIRLNQRYV